MVTIADGQINTDGHEGKLQPLVLDGGGKLHQQSNSITYSILVISVDLLSERLS